METLFTKFNEFKLANLKLNMSVDFVVRFRLYFLDNCTSNNKATLLPGRYSQNQSQTKLL